VHNGTAYTAPKRRLTCSAHRAARRRSKNERHVNIRILSDVALIHGRSACATLSDGVDQEALYTDAYQKREGTWACVSACAIAPGA
jgi:hypothetical protein